MGIIISLSHSASAQIDTTKELAKVYVIRYTGFKGSAVNFRVIANDDVVCKLGNNRYSVFYLQPGTHKIYITTWDQPGKKEKLALELPVEAGKNYYLRAVTKTRFVEWQTFAEEITENSALPLLAKYKEEENKVTAKTD
jgi:hypothetical protein